MLQNKRSNVAILLAAYNGEQYISEQLDSILIQKHVNISIIISLDNSTDKTVEIIQLYMKKYPEIITLLPYGATYGSAGQNFVNLLNNVNFSPFQYIAFSDQDDIWNENKLYKAITKMTAKCVDGYSSNVIAFWGSNKSKLVKKNYLQVEYDYLFESPGPGCTFVLTQELAVSIKKHLAYKKTKSKELWLHDWFCYSYARFNQFDWFIDSEPLMMYRQHSDNEIGANSGWEGFISRFLIILHGEGFTRVLSQASFIGQSQSIPIKLIKNKSRFSMLKLLLISWKCRRKFSHKIMFSFVCVVFMIRGCKYYE